MNDFIYFFIRFTLLILTACLSYEDLKTNQVNSCYLNATSLLQVIAGLLLFDFNIFFYKICVVIVIIFFYKIIPFFNKGMGNGDIQYICGQLISYKFLFFKIFWMISLLVLLVMYFFIPVFKRRLIPMFPAMFFADIITLLFILGSTL